ncbi:hypothetical protein PENTCL1PPCAC_25243, partial [Pristionchus entomophagus]
TLVHFFSSFIIPSTFFSTLVSSLSSVTFSISSLSSSVITSIAAFPLFVSIRGRFAAPLTPFTLNKASNLFSLAASRRAVSIIDVSSTDEALEDPLDEEFIRRFFEGRIGGFLVLAGPCSHEPSIVPPSLGEGLAQRTWTSSESDMLLALETSEIINEE